MSECRSNISRRAAFFLVASNLATLSTLAIFGLCAGPPRAEFEEINVQRINVVSPEGRTVLAISNKERIAPPVLDGKTYSVETSSGRENMAGMIFFNQEGDEMGGLLFNSFKMPSGRSAGIGHLSFDRYKDNQVIALRHIENAKSVQSGLTIYDRPGKGQFKSNLDLVEEHRSADPGRKQEIERALSDMREKGELGSERLFLGSKDETAQLVLKDSKGRVRIRLWVDERGESKLEFLNEVGATVAVFPPAQDPAP
ncbi:MAG: hypothetical protein KF805_14875 [Phycisphaeraceae bacterium]|nr:hypothetical protein [Phycisphaeraceae bacterium]